MGGFSVSLHGGWIWFTQCFLLLFGFLVRFGCVFVSGEGVDSLVARNLIECSDGNGLLVKRDRL